VHVTVTHNDLGQWPS